MFADKLQMSENEKSSAHVSATCADGSRVVDENVSQSLQDEVKE